MTYDKTFRSVWLAATLVLVTLFVNSGEADTQQSKAVTLQDIALDSSTVNVRFYDPLDFITTRFPDFSLEGDSSAKALRSSEWSQFLINAPLYTFTLNASANQRVFVVHGDSTKSQSAYFWRLDVLNVHLPKDFTPFKPGYEKLIDTSISLRVKGTLFENMRLFSSPENKELVGNGIKFLGFYRRVTPYAEVKNAVIPIIGNYLK